MVVRRALHSMGHRYRLHRSDLPGTPDICLPRYRLVVLVNGCFWHGHDCRKAGLPATHREFWAAKIGDNKARDDRVTRELDALGWRVCTVWECETSDPERLEAILRRALEPIAQTEA
jgi:DNA mismatch endonuclease (patch repair protein)